MPVVDGYDWYDQYDGYFPYFDAYFCNIYSGWCAQIWAEDYYVSYSYNWYYYITFYSYYLELGSYEDADTYTITHDDLYEYNSWLTS